jgi:hypothetical protein
LTHIFRACRTLGTHPLLSLGRTCNSRCSKAFRQCDSSGRVTWTLVYRTLGSIFTLPCISPS